MFFMSRRTIALAAAAFMAAGLAVGQQPAPASGPDQPAKDYGRLGGGYRDAKWGMSLDEVKKLLGGRLDYETRLQNIEKTLRLDLGKGREVTCLFYNDQFFQAIYKPVTADNDQQAAEAVLDGLNRKYGPGKDEEGFSDKDGKPLKIVTWNDGISKIELRMRDPKPPEKVVDQQSWVYPSSTLAVIYLDIAADAKRQQRQEAERQRQETIKRRQMKDLQNDL
jgi:hypothetical protein